MANDIWQVPNGNCGYVAGCCADQRKVDGKWICSHVGCPLKLKSSNLSDLTIPSVPQSDSFGWPPYSRNRMALLLDSTLQAVRDLNHQKGGEYAGDDDALANFRRNAQALGLSPEAIWGVYAAKHFDAIMQYVKDLSTGKTRSRSESIAGRADDLITYLVLFKALLQAREESSK